MIVEFVAEFTLDPAQSTGRFEKYTDGSFVMMATTVPFSPEPGDDGYTEGFEYTWVGTGHLSFPVGTVYQVTSTADSGEGSLREAIEQANSVPACSGLPAASGSRSRSTT